jgi:hypothetical protein
MAKATTKAEFLALINSLRAASAEGSVTQDTIGDLEESIHDLAIWDDDFAADQIVFKNGAGTLTYLTVPDNTVLLKQAAEVVAMAVAEDRVVGRVTGGNVAALTGSQLNSLIGFANFGYAIATYDFGVEGGAISEIDLGIAIPDNAVVMKVVSDEITTLTSATNTATIEAKLGTTAAGDGTISDVRTADGANGGLVDEATNYLKKTTAARNINVEIKNEAITAGVIAYIILYAITQ